ncbi:hypothetical protein [Arthrobacter sp. 92]|jgi:hypothetical protein|uniref:hypothetical protein n=1 Tax=Arthrobacter sp. 92 TaxID=3418175 RepID=UPI003D03B722
MDPDDPTPATGKLRLYDMAVYPSRWDGGMHIDMEAKFPEGATVKFYWAPANAEAPKGLTLEPVLWCQAGERSTPWLDGNPNLRELGCGDTEATASRVRLDAIRALHPLYSQVAKAHNEAVLAAHVALAAALNARISEQTQRLTPPNHG